MSDTIILKIIVHGVEFIEVDEEEYLQAKEDGTLDHFLDWQLSDVDTHTTIIEPDGAEVWPYD